MNRMIDTRILIVGLVVVLGLLARPLDTVRASFEATGSIPAKTSTVDHF